MTTPHGKARPKGETIMHQKSDREFVMQRTFDAPRERVFQAHVDPKLIPQWWGPASLTTKVVTMDVRPGGLWRFVQRDPDGNEHGFRGEYREIAAPRRIVQTFEYEGAPGNIMLETLEFEDLGGRTRLTVTSVFDGTQEAFQAMLDSGMEEGARETWDRLAALVEG